MAETSRKGQCLQSRGVLGREGAELGGREILGLTTAKCACTETTSFRCQCYQPVTCSSCTIHNSECSWRHCEVFQEDGLLPSRHGFLPCLDAREVIASQGCKGETFTGTKDYPSRARVKPAVSSVECSSHVSALYLLNDAAVSSPSDTLPEHQRPSMQTYPNFEILTAKKFHGTHHSAALTLKLFIFTCIISVKFKMR